MAKNEYQAKPNKVSAYKVESVFHDPYGNVLAQQSRDLIEAFGQARFQNSFRLGFQATQSTNYPIFMTMRYQNGVSEEVWIPPGCWIVQNNAQSVNLDVYNDELFNLLFEKTKNREDTIPSYIRHHGYCNVCHHKWKAHHSNISKVCPKCKSYLISMVASDKRGIKQETSGLF